MYQLKNSPLVASTLPPIAKATDSTLQPANYTDSTFQTSNSITFLETRMTNMRYEVEYTNEFEEWWLTLDQSTQVSIEAKGVKLLQEQGPNLLFPYSSNIKQSRHGNMRELRVQHKGEPYRILYAFDPRRVAILLLGGNKVGNDRWYEENVPKADKLYDQYLREIKDEGLI